MASPFAAFGRFYARSFAKHPWLTLAAANGTLGVVADSLAQTFEKQQRRMKDRQSSANDDERGWDFQRSGRFLAFGVGMAPLLAEWNKFIEFRFPLRSVSPGAASSATSSGSVAAARGSMAATNMAAQAGKVSLAALGKRVAFDQILL